MLVTICSNIEVPNQTSHLGAKSIPQKPHERCRGLKIWPHHQTICALSIRAPVKVLGIVHQGSQHPLQSHRQLFIWRNTMQLLQLNSTGKCWKDSQAKSSKPTQTNQPTNIQPLATSSHDHDGHAIRSVSSCCPPGSSKLNVASSFLPTLAVWIVLGKPRPGSVSTLMDLSWLALADSVSFAGFPLERVFFLLQRCGQQ